MKNKTEILEELKNWDFAHRGLYDNITSPENSLSAFRKAVEKGYAIELDVHLTKDEKLVVVHDSSLKRMSGVELDIEGLTLEESKQYPLLSTSETMPEFKEVLSLVNGKVPLLVELKVVKNTEKLVDKVMEELDSYDGLYVIESFYPFALKYLKEKYPEVARGQLAGNLLKESKKSSDADIKPYENFLMKNLFVNLISSPDFVAFKYEDICLKSFKRYKGYKYTWTVRKYEDYLICKEQGITPIFEKFDPKEM
ncbi:MAG: glycerophosphodiester phosphodiesterase [Clostridia bacterium]|nr:glycerophosphodiester phosphodiesterase [Clostridia bacterium]